MLLLVGLEEWPVDRRQCESRVKLGVGGQDVSVCFGRWCRCRYRAALDVSVVCRVGLGWLSWVPGSRCPGVT